MNSTPQFRRAGPIVALLALAVWGCTDSPTGPRNGAIPVKPSFAPGSNASANLDQWANGAPPPTGESWQNGNLNGNNSAYAEGKAVPFRLALEGLVGGSTGHQITIQYDFTAGGHKAYDYLASIEATETTILQKICAGTGPGGRSSLCGASTTSMPAPPAVSTSEVAFPPDGFRVDNLLVSDAQTNGAVPRFLRIYGGTITNISGVSHVGCTPATPPNNTCDGNSTGEMLVTFSVDAGKTAVQLVWSGHLAKSTFWNADNPPDGAGQVSGAPWHMRTLNLDGSGAANQDRSIQPSAIVAPPAVTVSKNADANTVSAGSPIGFIVTVNNTGTGDATGFVLNDPLPAGSGINWSIASQTGPAGVTCAISGAVGSQILRCPPTGTVTFPAGGTLTVHITSPTTFASCATYNNTATVSLTNGSAPPPAVAQTTVQCPLLQIQKTADASAVSAGSAIGFTITVSNTGQGTATGVTLSDALPGGAGVDWSIDGGTGAAQCSIGGSPQTETLTCNFGDLATGASKTVHLTSGTTSASCKAYPNTATAQATNHAQVQAQATTTVNCGAIGITKTADASPVNAGEQIGFTITVTNTGAGDATGVTVTDNLPTQAGLSWSIDAGGSDAGCSITAGVLTCNFGTLASGASKHVHITSSTTFASCATIPNTANVTTTNDGSGQATDNVVVQCPNLVIDKLEDAASVSAGSPIGFLITVTNSGAGTAKSVTLSDALPGGSGVDWSISGGTGAGQCSIGGSPPTETLSCNFGDMLSGTSKTVHLTSPTTFASCATYPNTASAQATNHAQVQDNASTTVQCPSIHITKTADAASVSAGDNIGFLLTVSNTGPGTATGVVLTDALPTNGGLNWSVDGGTASGTCVIASGTLTCNIGSLGVGSVTVHLTSPTTAASCGTVNNTGQVTTANDGSDEASASILVKCPDLSVEKTASNGTISAGDVASFTITVTNNGQGTAKNVTLNDPLPAGLSWSETPDNPDCSINSGTLECSFGDLAKGDTRSVTVSAPTTAANCGTLHNVAVTAAANEPGTLLEDNTDDADIVVNCGAIDLTKVADQGTVSAGDQIGFTLTVKNTGQGNATNVHLTDVLPTNAGLSWSESPDNPDCTISAGTLDCNFGTLAPNDTRSVHIVSPTTSASCGTVNNTGNVTTGNDGSDEASASVTVQCPNIDLTKVADQGTVSAGSTIGFVITFTNAGPGQATGVTVTDNLPGNAGLNWTIDAAGSDAGCSISAGVLTCNFGTVAAGGSKHVHITSPTTAASCAVINNTANVTTTNNGSDQATGSVTVQCPNIDLTKAADASPVNAGTNIGFTLTVTNSGPGNATGVVLTDVLPTNAGLSWSVNGGTAAATCSIASGTLTCNIGSLAAGASATVHLTSPTTPATCGTVNNTGNVTTTNDGSDQASASIVVNCPVGGQITPTATTCSEFNSGTSADLTEVFANVKNGNINNVAPGVFFYYTKFTVSATGTATVVIGQTNDGPAGWPNFQFKQDQVVLYSATCQKLTATLTTSQNNSVATLTFPATAGTTYIVGVKYETGAVVGQSGASLPNRYFYTTTVNGTLVVGNNDFVDLKVKP